MKIVSWNVNGLRAIWRKGLAKEIREWEAEIICFQETKTNVELCSIGEGKQGTRHSRSYDDVDEEVRDGSVRGLAPPCPVSKSRGTPPPHSLLDGYREFWGLGERAGYAGTLGLVKEGVEMTERKLPKFLSDEGRGVWLENKNFHLLNIYFPNGGQRPIRLKYKMKYYQEFLELVKKLQQEKPVIFCGDVNTAHQEIDLARPKENSQQTGFLPEERAWLDQVVAAGMVDVWRKFHPKEVEYSWWDYKTRARARNVGWRIDYFFCTEKLMKRIKKCELLTEIKGSDHAPVLLEIEV
jgi:exodeoxyribonuclease-3